MVPTASLLISLSSAPTKRPSHTPSQWPSSPSRSLVRFRPPPCLRYLRARDLPCLNPSQWHSYPSSISTLHPSQSSAVPARYLQAVHLEPLSYSPSSQTSDHRLIAFGISDEQELAPLQFSRNPPSAPTVARWQRRMVLSVPLSSDPPVVHLRTLSNRPPVLYPFRSSNNRS